MPVIPVGFGEVAFICSVTEGYREQRTALGYSVSGIDPDTVAETTCNEWEDFIDGIGWPNTATVRTEVRVGTSDPSAPLVYASNIRAAGSGTNALLPPNNSLLATKRTLLGGRKGRGRMYLPAPLEAQVGQTGDVDATFLGNVQDLLDTLVTEVGVLVGGDPYLLHTDSTAPTAITSVTLQPLTATQRRRLAR